MKQTKIVKVEQEELVMVECNKCGKMGWVDDDLALNLFHSFATTFHYGSPHDMERWDFDLCEKCLLEFINTFKTEPEKEHDHHIW